jgi:hypothetical protein
MSILATLLSNVTGAAAGGVLGGALRLIPEGIKYFDDRDQRRHELEMSKVQMQIDSARAAQQIDLVHAQGSAATDAGKLQLEINAGQAAAAVDAAILKGLDDQIKVQGQLTGVKWVDAVNATVRPFATYLWIGLFSLYKFCLVWIALTTSATLIEFSVRVWTPEDSAMLSGIMTFWFLSREIRYSK